MNKPYIFTILFLILSALSTSNNVYAGNTDYCNYQDGASTISAAKSSGLQYNGYSFNNNSNCSGGGGYRYKAVTGTSGTYKTYWSVPFASIAIAQQNYILPEYRDESSDYDENGCIIQYNICPGDANWIDQDGYDINGFDINGLDRGGNTAAQGGGYDGSAGTGGTSPNIPPPAAADPQNGNNYSNGGILYCQDAYPGYVINTTPPIFNYQPNYYICSNDCQYYNTGTAFDSANGYLYEDYSPTGFECNGEEPVLPLNIGTYNFTPPQSYPDYECFLNLSLWNCYQPPNYNYPAICFLDNNGDYGQEVSCTTDVSSDISQEVCGYINGVYGCYDPNNECQYVSGDYYCFVPGSGVPVPSSSPDHPLNGGNLDGNENNDPTSTDDVSNITQPNDQTVIDELRLARAIGDEVGQKISGGFSTINTNIQGMSDRLGTDLAGINSNITTISDELFNDAGHEFTTTQTPYDIDALNTVINTEKQLFDGNLATIKFEAESLFALDLSEVGQLPCPSFEVWSTSYEICISDYEPELSVIGSILVFMSFVIGFGIILRD